MPDYSPAVRAIAHRLQQADLFRPAPNPSFGNPAFAAAPARVLIVRLSSFADVERSTPHLLLADAVRRATPGAYVDFCFFPPPRDRECLRAAGVPLLLGNQSGRSVSDFDLVLVSNAYLLELINLPFLLLRSGVPLYASDRGPEWPPILLGGSNAMATHGAVTEAGDSWVDAVFFGEGERRVEALVRELLAPNGGDKGARLARAAATGDGLWVTGRWPAAPVRKAVFQPATADCLPVRYPVLNGPEALTVRLQINFGCPAFCSFCFETYDRKPYRELPVAELLAAARELKRVHGGDQVDLHSFNFNTHSEIIALLLGLNRLYDRVSFKSQRVDLLAHAAGLLEAELIAGKSAFSIGVEGISERLRTWLHKSLPGEVLTAVLGQLLRQPIREIKLFYLLTGHETAADITEFRGFLQTLKTAHRQTNPGIRLLFSCGLLVRMPQTPLRHDRLFLDLAPWRQLTGPVKSACEMNGFQFRLAAPWPDYAVSQVLAAGGYWLHRPLAELAADGYCFDRELPAAYWERLRTKLEAAGHWTPAFLGEKGKDYPFPYDFVASHVSPAFLHRQFREGRAGRDSGYCLGRDGQVGRCLRCGACPDAASRRQLTNHRLQPPAAGMLAEGRRLSAAKHRLQPVFARFWLDPELAGGTPDWLNSAVARALFAAVPAAVDNVLSIREQLFTTRENLARLPLFAGEAVFAVRAWRPDELAAALPALASGPVRFLGLAPDVRPGTWQHATIELTLPAVFFPAAARRLQDYLHAVPLPFTACRDGAGYRLEIPPAARKAKGIASIRYQEDEAGVTVTLTAGPKLDLGAFLRSFPEPGVERQATLVIRDLVC